MTISRSALIGDYSRQNEECCARGLPARRTITSPAVGQTTVIDRRRSSARSARIINDDPFDRETSVTPGRTTARTPRTAAFRPSSITTSGLPQLTSITAYRDNKFIGGGDVDFNNLDIFYRADDGGYGAKFKTFTQELRLQGTTMNDRLDWLVGGFYANEDLTRRDNTSIGADADRYFGTLRARGEPGAGRLPGLQSAQSVRAGLCPQPADAPTRCSRACRRRPIRSVISAIAEPGREHAAGQPASRSDVFRQKGNNYALFTHNIFKITDQLSLTLGARYTIDHKKLSADLTSGSQCAAYRGNIARLKALAAAAAANPAGNGGLNPAIAALASALANQVLTPIGAAPCALNSVNGSFTRRQRKGEQVHRNSGPQLQADGPAADLRQLLARL